MGGYYTNLSRPGCDDPKVGGQHGMLLGQESKEQNALWHGIMPNVSTYRVPHYIVDVVGGGYVFNSALLVFCDADFIADPMERPL